MKSMREMDFVFKAWKASRESYLEYFDKYTLEQLNKVPNGFNNNLIWNIGHIIVAQQVLVYKGSNLQGYISDELLDRYKSGTKPTTFVSQQEADELKVLLTSQIETTINDFEKGIFVTYNERTTGTGFHLASIKDALEVNNCHEGIHRGVMMSIRKFV